MVRSCFLSTFVEFRSAVSEEESKMSQPIRGQGGHLAFPFGQKNTNSVEDDDILLPVKFHWIPFSGFRGEVENVSANQRPWQPSCFSDRPKKHKLGRGRWNLASCQVLLNSVKQFQRGSWECLSQSEARAAILFLAHLSQRLKWAIVIAHRPSSVRPSSVRPSVRKLSHFQLLLQNCLMDFDETW